MLTRRSINFLYQKIEKDIQRKEENYMKIYHSRRDTKKIREKLIQAVNNPYYWVTFDKFLHGGCNKEEFDEKMNIYLATNELKLLHNEFIRAILYNAHYSLIPPPDAVLPNVEVKPIKKNDSVKHDEMENVDMEKFCSYSAIDLGRIQTLNELGVKMRIIADKHKLSFNTNSSATMREYLIKMIKMILKKTMIINTNVNIEENNKIMIGHLVNALKEDKLESFLSPYVLSKYYLNV